MNRLAGPVSVVFLLSVVPRVCLAQEAGASGGREGAVVDGAAAPVEAALDVTPSAGPATDAATSGPAAPADAPAAEVPTAEPDLRKKTVNISPWDLHPALDGGLMLGAALMLVIDLGFKDLNRGPGCGTACDPATVNPFDRTVIGWYDTDVALASDITLGLSIGLPFLAQAIDTAVTRPVDGWRGFGKDVLVLTETLAMTAGLTNFLKYAVGRTRPYSYIDTLPEDVRTEKDAGLSFPSGHTSMSFAMATSWSWLYMKRHPDSPAVVPIWVGSYAIATTTALLRPVAGKHFWTDIIAGAALGIGIGLLVPYFHELVAKKNRASKGAEIIVSPTVMEGGGGAVVTVIR